MYNEYWFFPLTLVMMNQREREIRAMRNATGTFDIDSFHGLCVCVCVLSG